MRPAISCWRGVSARAIWRTAGTASLTGRAVKRSIEQPASWTASDSRGRRLRWAGEAGEEQLVRSVDDGDADESAGEFEHKVERGFQALFDAGLDQQAVDDDFD